MARDGQVLDAQVVQRSGSDLLDQAAMAMFRGARVPQFPADMAQQLAMGSAAQAQLDVTLDAHGRNPDAAKAVEG